MGDEHDADALGGQAAQHVEQVIGLLRGKHGSRLVGDQHTGVSVQRLEDLDPLLRPDGQVFHRCVGVDVQAEAVGQVHHPAARLGHVDHPELARLGAEHDVAHHAHRRHELEMLMHHADAAGNGVVRARQLHVLVGDHDLAGIGAMQAEQHVDERALASTVLAQQRQYPSGPQFDRHVFVRHHRAEPLGDAAARQQHRGANLLDGGTSVHCSTPYRNGGRQLRQCMQMSASAAQSPREQTRSTPRRPLAAKVTQQSISGPRRAGRGRRGRACGRIGLRRPPR